MNFLTHVIWFRDLKISYQLIKKKTVIISTIKVMPHPSGCLNFNCILENKAIAATRKFTGDVGSRYWKCARQYYISYVKVSKGLNLYPINLVSKNEVFLLVTSILHNKVCQNCCLLLKGKLYKINKIQF